MAAPSDDPRLILDRTLTMADEQGWANLSLADLSAAAGLTIPQVRRHYADLNALADAWFALALDAMLAPTARGFDRLKAPERLELILWRWFTFLAPHRKSSADMLRGKLHAPHVHHWVPMVFDLSRLVQLWRDASGLRSQGRQRQVEEVGLTAIFLATLADWCNDDSDAQEMTRARLRARLGRADRIMAALTGRRRPKDAVNHPTP